MSYLALFSILSWSKYLHREKLSKSVGKCINNYGKQKSNISYTIKPETNRVSKCVYRERERERERGWTSVNLTITNLLICRGKWTLDSCFWNDVLPVTNMRHKRTLLRIWSYVTTESVQTWFSCFVISMQSW